MEGRLLEKQGPLGLTGVFIEGSVLLQQIRGEEREQAKTYWTLGG